MEACARTARSAEPRPASHTAPQPSSTHQRLLWTFSSRAASSPARELAPAQDRAVAAKQGWTPLPAPPAALWPSPPCVQTVALLSLESGTLDVASLSQLPGLQQLSGGNVAATAEAPAGGWCLPPRLRELNLPNGDEWFTVLRASLAGALHLPDGSPVTFSFAAEVWLDVGEELPTAGGTALTAEGEAALCVALRFLGQHLPPETAVNISSGRERVLPVGGPDGVGPGRRNHHAWLAELGALKGQPRIILAVGSSALWISLSLSWCQTYLRSSVSKAFALATTSSREAPFRCLPCLLCNSRLECIAIGADALLGIEEGVDKRTVDGHAGQLHAAIVGLFLCGWRGRLVFANTEYCEGHEGALAAAVPDLRAHGLDRAVELWDAGYE